MMKNTTKKTTDWDWEPGELEELVESFFKPGQAPSQQVSWSDDCAQPSRTKHYGPGPHPGTGSPQSAHGGRSGISEVEAEGLAGRVRKRGGFTYHPIDDRSPRKGFAVSIFPKDEHVVPDSLPEAELAEVIYDYLLRKRRRFADQQIHIGGWHDKKYGKIYLDLIVVKDNKEEADALARTHAQEGFFDLETQETIIVKKEAERRKSAASAGVSMYLLPVTANEAEIRKVAGDLAKAVKKGKA
jgi:hypothetical protein